MEEIGYTIRELITNGYHFFDVDCYYSSTAIRLDSLDISFQDNVGHYCFHDDIIRDIIFDIELGL